MVVRGLAMVSMALDHIREFWSPTPVRPKDVAQASVLLLFTRWVTHFCAPTFVLLAGTSGFLYQQKQPSRGAVSRYLLTRGLWLVALEIVVINFLLQWGYKAFLLQVIWVLGWSMVLLAGLIWLPRWLAATLALGFWRASSCYPSCNPWRLPTCCRLCSTVARFCSPSRPNFHYLLHFCLLSGGAFVWTTLAFGHPFNLSFAPPGVAQPAAYHPSLLRAVFDWIIPNK